MKIRESAKKVLLLATDFDGVHTDGFVYVSQDGVESVRCSRRDSLGLEMLRNIGVECCVISKETNPVVLARCKKLGIECHQGLGTGNAKKDVLMEIMFRRGLERENVAYIGDDVNDFDAMKCVGFPITVVDGHPSLKEIALFVTKGKSGEHILREVADMLIDAKVV